MNSTNKINILYLQLSNPKTKTLGGSFYSLLNIVTGLNKGKYDITVDCYYKNNIIEKMNHIGISTTILPYYRDIFMESIIVNLLKRLFKKNGKKFESPGDWGFKDKKEKTFITKISLLRGYFLSLA